MGLSVNGSIHATKEKVYYARTHAGQINLKSGLRQSLRLQEVTTGCGAHETA
jgi:histidine ammonia-lyase